MAIMFFDSSTIVKRYIAETGSAWVTGLMTLASGNTFHIGVISGVKVVAAFTRRQRGGTLSAVEASRAVIEFTDDWNNLFEAVSATRDVIDLAMILAQKHGLRGYDAVQLASAVSVKDVASLVGSAISFVSADDELNKAASSEGFQVENPNNHP